MDFRPGLYPQMKALEDRLMEQARQCVRDYGYKESLCFPLIENFWFNVNGKHHTNMVHTHDNTFIAGVFYLKAYPGQGKITLFKEYSQDYVIASQAPIEQYKHISASAISFDPVTSRLILFPGALPHGVGANTTDEDRISVSFNIKMIRNDDERIRIQVIE